jgi:16S rRNA (adenine1518-N6/adenine1519-N6)-dimethyltransferase
LDPSSHGFGGAGHIAARDLFLAMGAKYAQHFLTNQHAAERIAAAVQPTKDDLILEIGPGKGTMTAFFTTAMKMVVVEIDPVMATLLRQRFGSAGNVEIIESDILKFDFEALSLQNVNKTFKVVGNLPYNLTSPILRKLSDWNGWNFAVLMVQKEVGDRLCAKPGTPEYGALTVGMSLTTIAEPIFDLSPRSFNPPPKVTSTVIKLTRRPQPLTDNIEGTQRVIQAAFQQRRKTILNSLSHGLKLEKAKVENTLGSLGINVGVRPERLETERFIQLARAPNISEGP